MNLTREALRIRMLKLIVNIAISPYVETEKLCALSQTSERKLNIVAREALRIHVELTGEVNERLDQRSFAHLVGRTSTKKKMNLTKEVAWFLPVFPER